MTMRPWSPEEVELLRSLALSGKTDWQIAETLDRGVNSVRSKRAKEGLESGIQVHARERFSIEKLATPNRPIIELLEEQRGRFANRHKRGEQKRDGISVFLEGSGPYAITIFGDPHIDDDGCDIESLVYHLEAVNSCPDMYAINAGDLTNNWIGGLARLYAKQSKSDDEANELLDWLLDATDWVAVILGNHDKWTVTAERACKAKGVQHVSHGARFRFHRDGCREILADLRHTHKGNSMYNPSHAQVKQSFRGSPCDIILGAHTHTSGYTLVKNGVTGKVNHCVRVGPFKVEDEYADANGFAHEMISPAVTWVVNPKAGEPHDVSVWHDIDQAIDWLTYLKREAA